MKINDVAILSGLSVPQIEQAISRAYVNPHEPKRAGATRTFTPADAFMFCVAGALNRMGIGWPRIADAIAALPFPAVDQNFRQRDIFPAYDPAREHVLVYAGLSQETLPTAHFLPPDDVQKIVRAAEALTLPATKIARRIENANGR